MLTLCPPGPARAEGVDPQVLVVDLDVDLFGFGQHGDRDRGGVDAAAGFGGGHALDAVHAALVLQLAVDAAPLDHRDDFLEPADAGVVARHELDPPALALRVPAVHPKQLGGEQRRFVAAGAGPDFEHDVLLVVRVLRDEQRPSARRRASSRRAMSDLSSSCASSRMSAAPALAISSVWAMSRVTVLYSRNRSTIGSISESALACFRYSAGSLCTSADPSSCISSSYCCSVRQVNLSNIQSYSSRSARSALARDCRADYR